MKKQTALTPTETNYDEHEPECNTGYRLDRLYLMTFRNKGYVWYGVGHCDGHLMDWRGCNFWHGRIPGSPVFRDGKQALEWILNELTRPRGLRKGQHLPGHHAGENGCRKGCDEREVRVRSKDPEHMRGWPEHMRGWQDTALYPDLTGYMTGVIAHQKKVIASVPPIDIEEDNND